MIINKYYIILTKGQKTLVDKEDFEWLGQYNWYAQVDGKTGKYTACRGINKKNNRKAIRMHREILKCPDGFYVDHINHDTLDNRRSNLRVCTQAQNNQNRKKFKGDKLKGCYRTPYGTWNARISIKCKNISLGNYATEKEAHEAYCAAAMKYQGEFACTE